MDNDFKEKVEFIIKNMPTDKQVEEARKTDELVVVGANAVNIDSALLQKFLESGSKKDRRCMKCRSQVYLSPKSEEIVAEMAEPRVLCLSCAMAMAKGETNDAN